MEIKISKESKKVLKKVFSLICAFLLIFIATFITMVILIPGALVIIKIFTSLITSYNLLNITNKFYGGSILIIFLYFIISSVGKIAYDLGLIAIKKMGEFLDKK